MRVELLHCLKWFQFIDDREKRCVGGSKALEQDNTDSHDDDEDNPGAQVSWLIHC